MTDQIAKTSHTEETEKNFRRKKTRFFEIYISKVLKSITSSHGITANAKQQLNSVICSLARFLADRAVQLTLMAHKKTMSTKEVENAVRIFFYGNLRDNSVKHGRDAVDKFSVDENENDGQGQESKHLSRQNRANIIFPPSIAEKYLRNFGHNKMMVTKTTPVYLATVLQYVVSEILIQAVRNATENNHSRVTIRDLELGVRTDKELDRLFRTCSLQFLGGGVLPEIHEALLAKKPRKKRRVNNVNVTQKAGHRFRPGTVSLREIKKYQKASNCLTFAKFPFERFVRSIVNDKNSGMKISKDVFIVLQYYIEQYVVDFLRDSNLATIHSGRVKMMPADLEFICKLRRLESLDTNRFASGQVEEEEEEENEEENEEEDEENEENEENVDGEEEEIEQEDD